LKKLSTKQILEKLTIIQQENFVFSGTVKDNITMGEVAEDSEVAKYLEKVGLAQKDFLHSEVEVHGENLSGGQRQRLAIARALFNGKKILLIDEGTSALDKESAKSLVEMLLGNKELTIIMISHDISDELREKFDSIIKL
jgi:putative ABC transporter, ATP-binding protein